MTKVKLRKNNRERRKLRVKKKVFGTSKRLRLSVFRSNKHIYGQIIDDTVGRTLVHVVGGGAIKDAFGVGKDLAKKAKEKKINKVVFDRSGYKYHGRVKSFAEGAREGGLDF